MRILFLSRWYPWPADNGARLRVYHLIRALAREHQVHLMSFADAHVDASALAEMRQWCASVDTFDYQAFRPGGARALAAFFDARPRSAVDTFSSELARAVDRFGPVDLVLASQIDMAPYALGAHSRWRILEELEVGVIADHAGIAGGVLPRLRARLTWLKLSRYVRGLLRVFDACTVVSQKEAALVAKLAPEGGRIRVVPNGVDIGGAAEVVAIPHPNSLIYAGALTYHANFDAVTYFLSEIYPQLRERHPGIVFTVTGRTSGVDVSQLARLPGVRFSGYLDDVRPAVASNWLSVVPLRIGGGTRLKILESLALGTPVVATRKGAEGLDLEDKRDLLLADDPAEFVEAVSRVLTDPAFRSSLSEAGRVAAKRYDWSTSGDHLLALIGQLSATGGK